MPLQSRVDPWGRLNAVSERGAWLGNRGCLVDEERNIVRPWRLRAWITCELEWKGKRRPVFAPKTWTELFFLDEATAFAAGHRPCAFCRRRRYIEFKSAWIAANRGLVGANPRVAEIDRILHAERLAPDGTKRTHAMAYCDLPVGTMIAVGGHAHAVTDRGLARWSYGGYAPASPLPLDDAVEVLTPPSIVRLFRAGFRPQLHASAVGNGE